MEALLPIAKVKTLTVPVAKALPPDHAQSPHPHVPGVPEMTAVIHFSVFSTP